MQANKKDRPKPISQCSYLCFSDIRSLWAARSVNDFKVYFLTFVQGFETIFLNRGEMYEYIATVFSFNKSITFFCTEPLNFTEHKKFLLKNPCIRVLMIPFNNVSTESIKKQVYYAVYAL